MPQTHKYLYGVTLLIIIQAVGCAVQKPAGVDPGLMKVCDSTNIAINPRLAREFPHIDSLLHSWISDSEGIFQQAAFRDFFASVKTRLYFSLKEFHADTSAISYGAKIDTDGVFKDTIFLNKTLFNKESQEFLASVVIHENLHAYITWCCLSYAGRRNGVDETYLRRNFHSDWLRVVSQTFPDNEEEHILMTREFIEVMSRSLYPYTNRQSDPGLRETVARSLTWGGLLGTPRWKQLIVDTCYFRNVDIWARNMDADSTKGVYWGQCSATGVWFLHSLELQPLSN